MPRRPCLRTRSSLCDVRGGVRKLYYQTWEPSDFAQGKVGRDAAVIIKLPRLGYLIRVALDAMGAAEEP